METKTWKENVCNKPKLRLYKEFKRDKGRERYLELNMYKKERSVLAQFLLGILPIEVEVGRYRQKSLHDRTCPFCKNEVEDEFTFFLTVLCMNMKEKLCVLDLSIHM